jgi:hypothetical protein
MAMNEKEVGAFLESHFYASKKIKALEAERRQLRATAQGAGVNYESIGSTGTRQNGTEKTYMRLADDEAKIDLQISQLREEQGKVRAAIDLLNNADLEAVLISRYILHNTKNKTAKLLKYAPRAVAYKQRKAIKILCTLLH